MYQRNDLLLGQIALQWGLVKSNQLKECLTLQAGQPRRRPIGALLVDSDFISEEQLVRLIEEQRRRMKAYSAYAAARKEDLLFGKLLVKEGHASQQHVNEALGAQQDIGERGRKKRLGEILVDAGHITPETVCRTLRLQGKTLMTCRLCHSQYNVVITVAEGMTCRRCGRPLENAAGSITADETSFLLPSLPPLPPRPPTVRAAVTPAPQPAAPPAPAQPPLAETLPPVPTGRRRPASRLLFLLLILMVLAFLFLVRSAAW